MDCDVAVLGGGPGGYPAAIRAAQLGARVACIEEVMFAAVSPRISPPIDGIDSSLCVDSTGLLDQQQVPRRLVILGGGVIGCEFASIMHRFGSEVTIVEM